MKKNTIILLLASLVMLPLWSGGKADNDQALTEETASPAVSEAEEPSQPESAAEPANAELFIKLNRAGFDTPTEELPSIDFELSNLQGLKESLSDYRGKIVFLNFWATWCGPCRSEMPAMEHVYNELKDDGFVILAVDLAEDRDTVQKFVDDYGLTFPVLLDESGSVGSMYDARSIPTTYIVDRDGNILARAVGARPWEDEAYMTLFREILNL